MARSAHDDREHGRRSSRWRRRSPTRRPWPRPQQRSGSRTSRPGAELIDAAGDAARETVALAAEGAADLTSGDDRSTAPSSLDALSDLATDEAVADTVRGAATLEAAEETADVSALVAAVSADNLDRGMFLASLAGQLDVACNVVELMRMPVLAAFLDVKGRQLHGLAVNEISRAMAAAALAEGMEALSDRLAAIGLSRSPRASPRSRRPTRCSTHATTRSRPASSRRRPAWPSCPRQQAGARATRQLAGAGHGHGHAGCRGGRRGRGPTRPARRARGVEARGEEGPGEGVQPRRRPSPRRPSGRRAARPARSKANDQNGEGQPARRRDPHVPTCRPQPVPRVRPCRPRPDRTVQSR